ncbi:MAG: EamA family transporter [Ktedonobacteraceae bacterium]|nr:DMT family transporter [Chloroflexota bacterium]
MTSQALLLLGLAGLMHSAWNLLPKKSKDKQVFFWLMMFAALFFFLPLFLYLYVPIPVIGWGYIVLSGLLEACYVLFLGAAYQHGDISLVYPIARGSAPLFVTLIAFVFPGERASPQGIVGICLIVCGIYVVHLTSFAWRELSAPLLSLRQKASQLALLAGLFIASYSIVDKVGIRYVNPVLYIYLIYLVLVLVLAPFVLIARRVAIVSELRESKLKIIVASIMSLTTYLLVLFALTGNKVSYIASAREVSVVFAALLGAVVLRESFGKQKVVGSLCIFAGIVCIALS